MLHYEILNAHLDVGDQAIWWGSICVNDDGPGPGEPGRSRSRSGFQGFVEKSPLPGYS